jgi:hypothetical protein
MVVTKDCPIHGEYYPEFVGSRCPGCLVNRPKKCGCKGRHTKYLNVLCERHNGVTSFPEYDEVEGWYR